MKTTLMANADSNRRSQKAAVSAGSSASEAARGRENGASKGDIGASNGEIGAARLVLTASSAEGPVGMKPGKRPAQPLQNIALSRFRLPQVLHTTDMSKPLNCKQYLRTVHTGSRLSVSRFPRSASERARLRRVICTAYGSSSRLRPQLNRENNA